MLRHQCFLGFLCYSFDVYLFLLILMLFFTDKTFFAAILVTYRKFDNSNFHIQSLITIQKIFQQFH